MARTRRSNVDTLNPPSAPAPGGLTTTLVPGQRITSYPDGATTVFTRGDRIPGYADGRPVTLGIVQVAVAPSAIPGYHVVYAVTNEGALWVRRPPSFTWEKVEAIPLPAGDG